MKKITAALLTLVTSLPVMAATEKQEIKTYDVHCSVNDDRNGDQQILHYDATLDRKQNSGFIRAFRVDGMDHDLTLQLFYYEEDGIFILGVTDPQSQVTAQTAHHSPDYLYVFLGTESMGLMTTCSFKKAKAK